MDCSVQQKGSKLLFILNDLNEIEFNRLKIELGLHIVESISSKQFQINILDFILRKEGIIETLRKNKITPHISFKNFILTIYSLTGNTKWGKTSGSNH